MRWSSSRWIVLQLIGCLILLGLVSAGVAAAPGQDDFCIVPTFGLLEDRPQCSKDTAPATVETHQTRVEESQVPEHAEMSLVDIKPAAAEQTEPAQVPISEPTAPTITLTRDEDLPSSFQGPVLELSNERSSVPIAEFPSFAEWKQRHLASAAAAALSKDVHIRKGQHSGKNSSTNHTTSSDKSRDNSTSKDSAKPSAGDSKSSNFDRQDPVQLSDSPTFDALQEDVFHADDATSPALQRLLHPLPHAGSNDPLLDPLVQLRDRTNYASFDCSATLIRSSKSTKSASAILSSKKDRYMLTPCSSKDQFVIVELCDEIQIDTIVLANLEFFSSMFKLVKVTGGTAYPENTGTWRDLGLFRASNVRGMQVFRPADPTSGGFYRYLRIDFLSHYGTEYYCPVSLLKVYGLTQLDAYRRDQQQEAQSAEVEGDVFLDEGDFVPETEKPQETVYLQLVEPEPISESQSSQAETVSSETIPSAEPLKSTASDPETSSVLFTAIEDAMTSLTSSTALPKPADISVSRSSPADEVTHTLPQLSPASSAVTMPTYTSATPLSSRALPDPPPIVTVEVNQTVPGPTETTPASSATIGKDDIDTSTGIVVPANATITSSLSLPAESVEVSPSSSPPIDSNSTIAVVTKSGSVNDTTATTTAAVTSSVRMAAANSTLSYKTVTQSHPTQAVNKRNDTRGNGQQHQALYTPNNPQPNESIFGTIMKRLIALEVNATLSTAYIEEHSRIVWETLRRFEDRLSNMEKSRSKQDQLLGRLMLDLELRHARLEAERLELGSKLNLLSQEMVLEKRLGVAQLVALLVLLFFVILTRGSPSTPFLTLPHPRRLPNSGRSLHLQPPRSATQELSPHGLPLPGKIRESALRDKRHYGTDRRYQAPQINGITRTTSTKRPVKISTGSVSRRPTSVVLPMTSRSDYIGNSRQSTPTASTLDIHAHGRSAPVSAHLAETPVAPISLDELFDARVRTPSATTLVPQSATSISPKWNSIGSLRKKLKQLQPRRASSLDGSPLPTRPPAVNSVLDRRKMFDFHDSTLGRPRGNTDASADDESNSKAWLSTSEDSGDESAPPKSPQNWPTEGRTTFLPSPEPSENESKPASQKSYPHASQ